VSTWLKFQIDRNLYDEDTNVDKNKGSKGTDKKGVVLRNNEFVYTIGSHTPMLALTHARSYTYTSHNAHYHQIKFSFESLDCSFILKVCKNIIQ
jgi:hypothetical protein